MDIQQNIDNLKKYIREDAIYNDLKNIQSDFDQFCFNHCNDIKLVLDKLQELETDKNKLITYIANIEHKDFEEIKKEFCV